MATATSLRDVSLCLRIDAAKQAVADIEINNSPELKISVWCRYMNEVLAEGAYEIKPFTRSGKEQVIKAVLVYIILSLGIIISSDSCAMTFDHSSLTLVARPTLEVTGRMTSWVAQVPAVNKGGVN
jgi:hypothetical protein